MFTYFYTCLHIYYIYAHLCLNIWTPVRDQHCTSWKAFAFNHSSCQKGFFKDLVIVGRGSFMNLARATTLHCLMMLMGGSDCGFPIWIRCPKEPLAKHWSRWSTGLRIVYIGLFEERSERLNNFLFFGSFALDISWVFEIRLLRRGSRLVLLQLYSWTMNQDTPHTLKAWQFCTVVW